MANVYEQKLKKLYNQIGAMLQEASAVDVAKGVAQSAAEKVADFKGEAVEFTLEQLPNMSPEQVKAKCVPVLNEMLRKIGSGISFDKTAINTVEDIVKMVSQYKTEVLDHTDMSVYVRRAMAVNKGQNALKNIAIIDKITRMPEWKLVASTPDKLMADQYMAQVKKMFLIVGIGLVALTVILAVLVGKYTEVFSNISEAFKKLDLKVIGKALLSLAALGAVILPGLLGFCMITFVTHGFEDKGIRAAIIKVFYPILKLIQPLFIKVTEGVQEVAKARVMAFKKDFCLK